MMCSFLNLVLISSLRSMISLSKYSNDKSLVIDSGEDNSDELTPTLAVSMPQLEQLKLNDVVFEELTLHPELTPNVKELYIQNIGDECDKLQFYRN